MTLTNAKKKEDSQAWCPDCGDEIFIQQDKCEPYEHWTYHCFGCDKYFQLKQVPPFLED